jgi:predicted ATPase/class 3 adenylate cyclase
MQEAMTGLEKVEVSEGEKAALTIKVGIATGPICRLCVGDPQIQYIDVLAGNTLRQMSLAEGLAREGEVLLDASTVSEIGDSLIITGWRTHSRTRERFALVAGLTHHVPPAPWPTIPSDALTEAQARPWVLPSVRERLRTSPTDFLAELRPAVSLFLKFAGLDYDGDESAGTKLDAYIRWVQWVVGVYEGSLIQLTIGDKGSFLYAAFGTPVAHDDDAVRAVMAALELRRVPDELDFITSIQIGLGQGQARTGPYGSHDRRSYGVIGDDAVLAARLMGAAPTGQIRCDYNTYRSAQGQWAFETLAPVRVKGKVGLIRPYRPVESSAMGRDERRGLVGIGRRSLWGESPLVGRRKEVERLEAVLDAIVAGESRVLVVEGEAGIGKSRLIAELTRLARELGLTWLLGAGQSVEQQTPYRAWRDVFSYYFGLDEIEAPLERRERVQNMVEQLLPEQRGRISLLNDVLDLNLPETEWTANLDPNLRRHSLVSLLLTLLQVWAQERPLVLILEDAQWLDDLSWDLAVQVARALPTWDEPVLLVLVTRLLYEHDVAGEYMAALRAAANTEILSLTTLNTEEIIALVTARLRLLADGLPAPVAELICQRAEGNPFLAEELAFALRDNGVMTVEPDPVEAAQAGLPHSYRCVVRGDLAQASQVLPDTIQGLVLARIDQLMPERQLTLKVASVIGHTFAYPVLHYTLKQHAAIEDDALKHHLEALAVMGVTPLYATEPDLTYSFRHALTQEAAYQTLLYAQRRALHRTVAESLETLFPHRVGEQVGLLAHHWEQAEEPEKVVTYSIRAGERARKAYANEAAISHFQKALSVINKHSLDDRFVERHLEALKRLGQVYYGTARMTEAEQRLRQAIALAEHVALAPRERVQLYHWLGEVLWWQNRPDEQIRIGEKGLALLGENYESAEAALMNQTIAIGYARKGNEEWSRAYALRTAQFLQLVPYTEELRPSFVHIVAAYRDKKDVEKAMEWLRVLEERATLHDDWRALGEARFLAGDILARKGDIHGAITCQQQALEWYARIADAKFQSWCLDHTVDAWLSLGDLEKAAQVAARGLETARTVGNDRDLAWARWLVGRVALCQGDWERAIGVLESALPLCQEISCRWSEPWVVADVGRICLMRQDHAEARGRFERAATLAGSAGLKYYPARFATVLSGLEACGDPALFRAFCRRFRAEYPESVGTSFDHWYLEPARAVTVRALPPQEDLVASLSDWVWEDPFSDCSFALRDGIDICAQNGRDLWGLNLSAPRMTRRISGDLIAQATCVPVAQDVPSIGGLLIWKDNENYIYLNRGGRGEREISFGGCLENVDVLIGRGRLPVSASTNQRMGKWANGQKDRSVLTDRMYLRLERLGERVEALCSADGLYWFTVGRAVFSAEDPVQVGVYAIGNIDRFVYPGAYPDGTAIRFESVQLWEA